MMGGGFMHGRFNKDGKATGDDLVNPINLFSLSFI
jgi:hypothetical protein